MRQPTQEKKKKRKKNAKSRRPGKDWTSGAGGPVMFWGRKTTTTTLGRKGRLADLSTGAEISLKRSERKNGKKGKDPHKDERWFER